MLDDLTLSARLTIASEWFRRARAGEFSLAGDSRQAGKFQELIDGCVAHAAALELLQLSPSLEGGMRVRFPDGRERDPAAIAARALRSDRDAMQISLDDVTALAFVVQTLLAPPAGTIIEQPAAAAAGGVS